MVVFVSLPLVVGEYYWLAIWPGLTLDNFRQRQAKRKEKPIDPGRKEVSCSPVPERPLSDHFHLTFPPPGLGIYCIPIHFCLFPPGGRTRLFWTHSISAKLEFLVWLIATGGHLR